jgi:hypothetical protein
VVTGRVVALLSLNELTLVSLDESGIAGESIKEWDIEPTVELSAKLAFREG